MDDDRKLDAIKERGELVAKIIDLFEFERLDEKKQEQLLAAHNPGIGSGERYAWLAGFWNVIAGRYLDSLLDLRREI